MSILRLFFYTKKPNKRMMVKTIPRETKRGRPKKGQKMHNLKGPKRGIHATFPLMSFN
jgi:hypothetical protein